jgi:undecaprenyl-diphosphatase
MKTKTKAIILSILILLFLTIAFLVANANYFVLHLDIVIRNFFANHQSPSISDLMLSITKVCNPYEGFAIFLIFGLFLFLKDKFYFYIFTVATSLGILLPETVKFFVQRIRPESIHLVEQGFSFPSDHATIATVFLLSSILLLAPNMKKSFSKTIFIWTTSIVFPLVAFSRIYLSVHWTSDVIAGIILGSICFIFSEIICCHEKENML